MLDESLKQKLWEAEDEIASWAEEISNSISDRGNREAGL